MNHSEYKSMLSKARAYSATLDERDEYQRNLRAARMNEQAAQQRAQTIRSMQTKKYELDERKLGVSQPKTQYVSALPILDTVDSVVNPAIKQNSPVVQGFRKTLQQYAPAPTPANMGVNNNWLNQNNQLVNSFQTAMPNESLVQQATNNFQQWNTQYEQDEDRYIDDLDRVTTLIGLGVPNEDADKQLAESEEKLNQTKAQWNSMMRQTLDMLGPGAENLIRSVIKDAKDKRPTTSPEKYQRMLQARELQKLLGSDLYGDLAEYVRQQENSIRMSKKKEAAAKFADENGVGASIVSVPKKLIGGISGVADTYAQTFDRIFSGSHAPLDWNTELQVPNREASTIRSTVAQNIAEDTGSTKVLPGLYNFGMGMVDAVATTPINVITGGWGTALMASAAANDTMQNVKARGGSDDQALTLGTVTLIAEILTEKMSFDDLDALDVSDMTKFKETLWNNVKSQGKSEGMEEGIAESIEAIADAVIMGDKSELRQSMQEYEAQGYNRDQALAMAIGGAAGNIMLSSAGGAASGGLFAAGKTTGAWALNKLIGSSQNTGVDVDSNSPFQVQVQQDVQQNQAEQAQANPLEVRQTQQNAPAAENSEREKLNEAMLSALRQIEQQKQAQEAQTQETVKSQGTYDDLVEALKRGDVSGDQIAKYASEFDESRSKDFAAWLDREVEEGRLKWRGDGKLGRVLGEDDHIDNRDYGSVGSKKVNAFQYNNPELHQYIAEGAEIFGGEVAASTPGERIYLGDNPNEAGSTPMWTGTKRHTTPQIEELKDNYRMSWSDLQTAVDDLIADDGRENNAKAKRVELAVDDILTNGTRLLDGTVIPPNQEYIAAKAGIAGGGATVSDVSAQDQLNGPILAAMNELNGQQTNQNADTQQPGKVPAPGVEAEVDKQPARGVGAAESGYSGDIGTWKRDASEFIKDTELPKQDKSGDTISDSAGSMFKSNVPKETKETIERYAYEGKYSYEKDVNKAQVERVHKAIEQDGFDAVYERTVQQLTDHRASADTTAQAWVLFIQAANRGDGEKAATLSKLIQRYSTSVAQALQANSIYNKLTPEGRLASIQRTVNRMNQDIEAQRGKSGSKGGLDGVAEVSVGDGQTVETASQAAINDAYETSLDLIRNIYKAFSENRNGEKLDFDQWMHKIGETLAKSIKGRTQGKNNMTVSRMIEQDILRFAKDYLPEAAKRKGRTAIDTLTQYYEHKDWYHEAWETAQDVLTEGSGRKLDNLAVDQTPVMERAIIEAAADQELSKKDIRLRDYLGSQNALASQISTELINQTGATGTDADNIKSACLRYIVEVSEGEGSERKTRNGGTINKAEAQVQADTNKLLKEAGTDIYKILKQHPSDREAVANEIADKLVSKYGLDEKAAQKASQKIVEQFNKMVADKSKSAIEKVIKDSKKEPTPKQRRTLTQALREAANSGMFSQKDSAAIVTRKLFGQEVQIDSALLQEYLNAKGKDQIQAVEDKIYKNIASQMPASLGEKARAWRYMGMLANPKTHINNFSGNVTMYGERKAKDTIKAGLEAIFLPQDQRTAAVLSGKERRAAAAADYENVKSMILDGDKYSDSANRKIQESRRIFSNSILEGIRVKNDELLNAFGDGIFAKANYTDAFAGILKARGYTAEDFTKGNIPEAQLDSMRAYAIKEAQKATFRDLNSFSRFVRDIGFKNTEGNAFKKGANVAVEGVLAFKKTPANVFARAVEYSPAGLLDALTRGSKQLANGDITASQYLDRVSSGLTGSALMGLGYLLSKLDLLKGGTGDDDEQDKLEGRQNFAIEIGGKSYTLTFLSPASMQLFMGAQLEQILDEGSGDGPMMDKVLNVLKGISDPILEMSMMSGLQDALESTDYADNKILAFTANAGLSYLTQYIPTLGGQIKRTFQKPQRTTTFVNEADPVLNKDAQRAIGTATNKIPGPSYQQIPYIDAWGRRQDQGNLATRAFNNLVNPMYVSELKQTDVDREIRRLEKQTGENYTPSRADSVLTIDGETVILTAEEYVTYAESKGQNDFEMRSNLIASATYKTLDDYTKGKAMKAAEDYANNLAEKEIGLNPPTPPWMEELDGKTAEEVTDALIVHVLAAQAGNSENKYNAYADQISSGVPAETVLMALTDNQKENYSKYIQKAKVPAETYLDALSFESKAKSDDKEAKNSKTKKEKVVAYIDGLKLTRKQKRALYLCFYSEKDDTFK